MKRLKRFLCLMMAVFLLVLTPASDYLGARDTQASVSLTAALFVWSALFLSAGVFVEAADIPAVTVDIGDWIQTGDNNVYWTVFQAIGSATWDSVLELGSSAVSMIKEYFKTKDGYGTDTGMDSIVVSGVESNTYRLGFDATIFNYTTGWLTADKCFMALGYVSGANYIYADYFADGDVYRIGAYTYNSSNFALKAVDSSGDLVPLGWFSVYDYNRSGELSENGGNGNYALVKKSVALSLTNMPVYDTESELYDYLSSGVIGDSLNSYDGANTWSSSRVLPVASAPDIQQREAEFDGTIAIPVAADIAAEILSSAQAAETAEDRADALAPSLTIVYGGKSGEEPEEPDGTFPWLPDITGAIKNMGNGLKEKLEDIKGFIQDVPGILGDILNEIKAIPQHFLNLLEAVKAIPGQIKDFFTVDTAAVDAAQLNLSNAFKGKFSGLYAISDALSFGAALSREIPVISIPVPSPIKFAYPDSDSIEIFDLRPYEDYFVNIRIFLVAALWLAFAYWLLDQFDVRFHVG
ncbi:hypothetical protein AALB39_28830 [Lachnospiraceae bacterium 54-53]